MEIYECNNCDEGTCYTNCDSLCCKMGHAIWEVAKGYSIYIDKSRILVPPVTEKKPELMTLQDAAQKMDFGDSFKIGESGSEVLTMVRHKDDNDMKAFKSDLHDDYVIVEPCLLLTKGKIIPAEPKVLTTIEIRNKVASMRSSDQWESGDINDMIELSDQNGQFKRDEDYKELREVVEYSIRHIYDDGTMNMSKEGYIALFQKIETARVNIKPLED